MVRRVNRGFSLVELLVILAILAILAIIINSVINPLEIAKRSRDATRLADLTQLQKVINFIALEDITGTTNTVCFDNQCQGLSTDENATKTDGTGWVKVNLAAQKIVSMSKLPLDPLNNGLNVYAYKGDPLNNNWEINAALESSAYRDRMKNDGGDDDDKYEIGTKLTIIKPASVVAGEILNFDLEKDRLTNTIMI